MFEREYSYLKDIIDNIGVGLITVNDEGLIESFNQKAGDIFGYTLNEVLNKNLVMLMPPQYRQRHKEGMSRYLTTQVPHVIGKGPIELEGLHKTGHVFPIELTINEIVLNERHIFTGIIRDISEKKEIEKLKNEFISVVSHELRTPLTSIHGSISLLASGMIEKLSPKVMKLLDIAKQNTELLIRLINDILDIEKIEAGKIILHLEAIELSKIIEEAITINQVTADKFGIKLEMAQMPSGLKVFVDHDRLLQVLNNLISNAIKFSPNDETIYISIQVPLKKNKVKVNITDKGPGVPKKFRSSIFQKFSQADSTAARKHQGTGLGLSISKAIIEKFNGTVGYISKKSEGTTFYFELPIFRETFEKITFKKIMTVLLCEDDVEFANLFKTILEQHDFKVHVSYTALSAKEKLEKFNIDVLLLDLVLPDQDGISLIKEIRQSSKHSFLPIIVVSAKAKEGKKELNGNSLNVLDWIEKPVDFERFLQTVQILEKYIHIKIPRILHVEDDIGLSQVVANVAQKDAEITSVTSIKTAKAELKEHLYDLVILDLVLPDGSGIELFPILSEKHIPIIVFSAYELPKEYAHFVENSLMKTRTSINSLFENIKAAIQIDSERS